MTTSTPIHQALQKFGAAVTAKMSQLTVGEPEDQIRGPFENFISDFGTRLGKKKIVCTGETPLPSRLGRPDYAIHCDKLLVGYVELKATGSGAEARRFKGHNLKQFKRFSTIPNLLYTDGNEWALYRNGEPVGKTIRLSGDVVADGKKSATIADANALDRLLVDFFSWEPIVPMDRKGKVDLKIFAGLLAPLCRMLRDDVTDALTDPLSPLVQLAKDWRQLLFPGAPDEQFADAYAQTVTFALLLGRSEGSDPLTLKGAEAALAAQYNLLSRALQVLTDPGARSEMSASLDLLLRVIAVVPPATLSGPEDPWLYFYEDFLAAYDPKLRKDVGAYYTPVEVVRCQVRLVDDLLVNRLGKPLGYADRGVVTLDPAAGTGTYLLGVIEHTLRRIELKEGTGAVSGQATDLAKNLYGFELLVGPYAVTELRVSRALRDRGATLPNDGTHIYLTDTLESPNANPPDLPYFLKPISEQHERALKIKSKVPVIVCIGNPPYDRHEAATSENKSRTGGWVRWGDTGEGQRFGPGHDGQPQTFPALFRDFLDPVTAAGHGIHLKWLYNLYVYFWRWALWKVFEHETSQGPGIVSFITASSYLFGDAFIGMREFMRRTCDEIWIIDLGGEGRGGRKDENVFAIQTPVAIAIVVREKKVQRKRAARVHYSRIEGTREEKFTALSAINDLSSVSWLDCPDAWQAPFLPIAEGGYFDWPIIRDLFPWQHSGSQLFRTWPIAPDPSTLARRWDALLNSPDRARAFKESRDRKISRTYSPLLNSQAREREISSLVPTAAAPEIVRYGYRSFDRQYTFLDTRIGDVMKPVLWCAAGRSADSKQLFLGSQLWQVLGVGPAIVASIYVPDFHFFKGSYGGKDVMPLYRDSNCSEPNILPGLLSALSGVLGRKVTAEDFLAYVYGILAQPAFTSRFAKQLETRELRVPMTKDSDLFEKVRAVGAQLLWLHTYGERYAPTDERRGNVQPGEAKCTKAVPDRAGAYPESFEYNVATRTLHVGEGEFYPVVKSVFEFDVSGLKVVQSWLKYRMKKGAGKKSSPLDDIRPERWTSQFTTELLELLWVLEGTVAVYPLQASLLDLVLSSECFRTAELPNVPEFMRRAPRVDGTNGEQLDIESKV